MKKSDLQNRFPLNSYSEEDVGGAKVVSFSFRWTVPQEFIDLSDYPSLAIRMQSAPRVPQVIIEARAQVVGDGTMVLNAMELYFDIRPTARTLGLEIVGPGRAGFSPDQNYTLFLAGLVASMEAVVNQCKADPKSRKSKKDSEQQATQELRRIAEEFASSDEWKDREDARTRFVMLAMESFPN